MADHDKAEDARPDVAKDDDRKPRKDIKESWHRDGATLGQAGGGGPDAEKQSRTS